MKFKIKTMLVFHCIYLSYRMFTLQFLMIGKEKHMTMCFQSDRDDWHLYDNDQKQPSFQPFDLQSLKDYIICLVGYVNETQEQECKLGKSLALFSDWLCDIFEFFHQV